MFLVAFLRMGCLDGKSLHILRANNHQISASLTLLIAAGAGGTAQLAILNTESPSIDACMGVNSNGHMPPQIFWKHGITWPTMCF